MSQTIIEPRLLKDMMNEEDVMMVMDILGIQYKHVQGKLVSTCPDPKHNDRKPSWDINVTKGKKFCIHSCFSCGYSGDIISLIQDRLKHESRLESLKFLSGLMKNKLTEEFMYQRNLNQKMKFFEIRIKKKVKIDLPNEFELVQEGDAYYKYLQKSRRLSDSIIEKAEIGKCMIGYYGKRVVVPIRFQKKIVFFFARNNDNIRNVDKASRGWYPKYCKSSEVVYPYDWLDFDLDYVILVEGVFDCLRLWSIGYKNVVCMFGNKISNAQAKLLEPFKHIIMIPDADGEIDLDKGEATKGMLMVLHAYEKLRFNHKVEWVHIPKDYDPNDVPENILKLAFKNKTGFHSKKKSRIKVDYSIKKLG
jgi:DNA primase